MIISNIAHTEYIRFKAYSNFSKLLNIFANFGFYKISTLAMRIMLSVAKIVFKIIISNMAHSVYHI